MDDKEWMNKIRPGAGALLWLLIGFVLGFFIWREPWITLNQNNSETPISSVNAPRNDLSSRFWQSLDSDQPVDEIPYFEFVDENLLPERDRDVSERLDSRRSGEGVSLSPLRDIANVEFPGLPVITSLAFPASLVREKTFVLEIDPHDIEYFENRELLISLSERAAEKLFSKRIRVNSISHPQRDIAVFSDSSGDLLLKGRTDNFDSILLLFRRGTEQEFFVRRVILSVDCEQIPAGNTASDCSDENGEYRSIRTVIDISREKPGENWKDTPEPVRFSYVASIAASGFAPAESRASSPYIDRYECKNQPLEPLVRPVIVFLFSRDEPRYLDGLVPAAQRLFDHEFGPGVIEVDILKIDDFAVFPERSPKTLLSIGQPSLPRNCVRAKGDELCEWLDELKELAFQTRSNAQLQDQWKNAVETALFFDISDQTEGAFPSGKVAQIPATPGGVNIGFVQPTTNGNHISDTAFVVFHEVGHLLGLQHQHPSVSTAYADFRDGRLLRNRPLESAPNALNKSGGECGWFNWWGCRSRVLVTAMYDQNMMPTRLSKSLVAETFGGGRGPCATFWFDDRELTQMRANASPIMVAYNQAKALSNYDASRATEASFSGKYAWPRFYEEHSELPSPPDLSFDCPRIDPLDGAAEEVFVGELLATFHSGSAEFDGPNNLDLLEDIDEDQPIRLIAFSDGVGDNGKNFILSYRRLWTVVSALNDEKKRKVTACIAGENLLPKQGDNLRSANCELNGGEEDQCRRAVYLRR